MVSQQQNQFWDGILATKSVLKISSRMVSQQPNQFWDGILATKSVLGWYPRNQISSRMVSQKPNLIHHLGTPG